MRVQHKETIFSLIEKNRETLQAFGVERIGLFGSFVHEGQNVESDIDLLVVFKPDRKTFDNFMQLSFFLEDLFQRPVELVTPESLSPYIKPHIIDEVEYVPVAD